MKNNLTCQEVVELVTDYLEGALPPTELARFEEHLSVCDGCRHYVEQMRLMIAAERQLSEELFEPAARAELIELFRNWKDGNDRVEITT